MACFGKADRQQPSNVDTGSCPADNTLRGLPAHGREALPGRTESCPADSTLRGPPLMGGEALPGRTGSWALRMG